MSQCSTVSLNDGLRFRLYYWVHQDVLWGLNLHLSIILICKVTMIIDRNFKVILKCNTFWLWLYVISLEIPRNQISKFYFLNRLNFNGRRCTMPFPQQLLWSAYSSLAWTLLVVIKIQLNFIL